MLIWGRTIIIMNDAAELYDIVIIGAGPTGLAAAIYASREGMKSLVVEKGIVGGMAAITDQIDNYPGFEDGISGLDLTDKLYAQAKKFGAEIKTGVEIIGVKRDTAGITLATKDDPIQTQTVLIATGSTYRQLGVPGEAELIGRGVHFCATCDGPIYRGKELIVVGGGNSAMQETLFLARFASKITMVIRGEALGGSEILREEVSALGNVDYIYQTTIDSIDAVDGKFKGVTVTNKSSGRQTQLTADGAFIFIGLLANTQGFAGAVALDEQNFVVSDANYATSMPGVFVAGDVRSGATWQIASAVGEGVSATLKIRSYLDQLRHDARHGKTVSIS